MFNEVGEARLGFVDFIEEMIARYEKGDFEDQYDDIISPIDQRMMQAHYKGTVEEVSAFDSPGLDVYVLFVAWVDGCIDGNGVGDFHSYTATYNRC